MFMEMKVGQEKSVGTSPATQETLTPGVNLYIVKQDLGPPNVHFISTATPYIADFFLPTAAFLATSATTHHSAPTTHHAHCRHPHHLYR